MQVTEEQMDRLRVIYDNLLRICQQQGDPPALNELHQRLRWWIEEVSEPEEAQA